MRGEQAEEAGAGLIAMTTHGRTGLGRLLLGSVAERVLKTVRVPVLLWKPPAAPSIHGPR
jgi:nucleotide-binding universal stress UspA family protein